MASEKSQINDVKRQTKNFKYMRNSNTLKGILIISLVVFVFQTGFSQTKWIPSGATWHYNFETVNYQGYQEIYCDGDTIIQGQEFKTLSLRTEFYNYAVDTTEINGYDNYAFIRSDSNIVYWYHQNLDTTYTLYDFNTQAGDIWRIPPGPLVIAQDTCVHGSYSIAVVDSIDYIVNANDSLKRYHLSYNNSSPSYTLGKHVYEKMGSEYRFLPNSSHIVVEGPEALRCYEDQNTPVYNLTNNPCDFVVGIDEYETDQYLKVVPNPVGDKFRIDYPGECSEFQQVELYSADGTLMRKSEPKDCTINLSGFEKGMYLLRIKLDDRFVNRKVMKL